MRGLSLIIGLIGVFALLTLGVGGAWAATGEPAPCHAMSGVDPVMMDHAPAKRPMPAKAAMVMSCCVGCVSPAVPSAPVPMAVAHPRPVQPARLSLPSGRSPSPEPGPPRLRP